MPIAKPQATAVSTSGPRLRCDPTEHAKKKQAALQRAQSLRDQRSKGTVDDECSFKPRVNSRKKCDETGGNQVVEDVSEDSLDQISRKQSQLPRRKKIPEPQPQDENYPDPSVMSSDSLSNEVKLRTGKDIDRTAKKPTKMECKRNSSCTCSSCAVANELRSYNPTSERPNTRRRQRNADGDDQPEGIASASDFTKHPASSSQSTTPSQSLSLLKSKMLSRRKSRSAPASSYASHTDAPLVASAREPLAAPPPRERAQPHPDRSAATNSVKEVDKPRRRPKPVDERAFEEEDTNYDEPPPPAPKGVYSQVMEDPEDSTFEGDEPQNECPDCGRKFNDVAFPKHLKICKKVFQSKRKVFNMSSARLAGTEAEKFMKENQKAKGGHRGGNRGKGAASSAAPSEDRPIQAAKKADWKAQSNLLREAMKANRQISQALKDGKDLKDLPPPPPSAKDPSLIPCSSCGRSFNEKAAERHIPRCQEQAKRNAFKAAPAKADIGSSAKSRLPARKPKK